MRGIKRHVLTCSLGFVLAILVTAANMHDTQPVGAAQIAALLDRAARGGWLVERVKVDGISIGPRMAQVAQDHGVDVQVTTRDADVKSFMPLPLRWRIEATFGTLANRWHRLTRNLEQSPAAAEVPSASPTAIACYVPTTATNTSWRRQTGFYGSNAVDIGSSMTPPIQSLPVCPLKPTTSPVGFDSARLPLSAAGGFLTRWVLKASPTPASAPAAET